MRAALASRRGSWAVLETFDSPTKASSVANMLTKRRDTDSRLTGIEFAGRKELAGGSKLYVRQAPGVITAEERQRARDRAADAIGLPDPNPKGGRTSWPRPFLGGTSTDRARRYRARRLISGDIDPRPTQRNER